MTPSAEQVRFWIAHVLNPLVSNLRREVDRLQNRSLSWSHQRRILENLHLSRSYVRGDARDLVEQLVRYQPNFGSLLDRHDRVLRELVEAAEQAQRALEEHVAFRRAVQDADAAWHTEKGGAEWTMYEPAATAAELVSNGVTPDKVVDGYTFAEFWRRHGATLLVTGQSVPEVQDVHAKRARAAREIEDVLREIVSIRDRYADAYQLPAAGL